MKPVIGITTFIEKNPRKPFSSVSYNYVTSVSLAGGIPFLIPVLDTSNIGDYLENIDGLLLTGGDDVSPRFYNEDPISKVTKVNSKRDEFEIALFNGAVKCGIPILGICRGAQIINVAMGGSLYQDIEKQVSTEFGHCPGNNPVDELYHSVEIYGNSNLHQVMGVRKLYVNSFHHQAVKKLAEKLTVCAVASDDIIEAFESEDGNIIGIQWHPEDLTIRYEHFLRIFGALIKKAGNKVQDSNNFRE